MRQVSSDAATMQRGTCGYAAQWPTRRRIYAAAAAAAVAAADAAAYSHLKGAITSKIKHAIKHKTSPARLAQLLHNCCSPH